MNTLPIHEPTIEVRMVPDATGAHVEPPLDPTWSPLQKLEWKIALVRHETGLRIGIRESQYWIGGHKVEGLWDLYIGGTASTGHDFEGAWAYLNGISTGVAEATREVPFEGFVRPAPLDGFIKTDEDGIPDE